MTDEDLKAVDRHPSPWQPESRPRVLALIGKLGEEATELAGICARITIQGLDAPHSDDGRPNRVHLEDEIADVAACTGLTMSGVGWRDCTLAADGVTVLFHTGSCIGQGALDYDRVEARREAKKRFLLAWLTSLSCEPPPGRDAIMAAYRAGAMAVHEHHDPDQEPDFSEAAMDYADTMGVGQ